MRILASACQLALAVVMACFGALPAKAIEWLPFQTIPVQGSQQQSFVVFRSQEQLARYLPAAAASRQAPIDFGKSTLLVASLGSSTGHRLLFYEVLSLDGVIYAHLYDVAPGAGCAVAQVISFPSASVLIPRTESPVKFEVVHVSQDCDQPHIRADGSAR